MDEHFVLGDIIFTTSVSKSPTRDWTGPQMSADPGWEKPQWVDASQLLGGIRNVSKLRDRTQRIPGPVYVPLTVSVPPLEGPGPGSQLNHSLPQRPVPTSTPVSWELGLVACEARSPLWAQQGWSSAAQAGSTSCLLLRRSGDRGLQPALWLRPATQGLSSYQLR